MGFNVVKTSNLRVDSNLNMQNLYTIVNNPPPTVPTDFARLSDLKLSNLLIDVEKDWLGARITDLGLPLDGGDAARLIDLPKKSALEYTIDGGGAAITADLKGFLRVPFGCTLTRVTMLADQDGDIVVDIWKDTYDNFPPDVADSITGGTPPEISGASKYVNSDLTGWTTAFALGDILAFNVDSCDTITRLVVILEVEKV